MTTTQGDLLSLLDPPPIIPVDPHGLSLDEQFERFHALNPHVCDGLIHLTRLLVSRGHPRVGIKLVVERLRWEWAMSTAGDTYKFNNNLTSRYARLIMANEPDLAGVFCTRELRS